MIIIHQEKYIFFGSKISKTFFKVSIFVFFFIFFPFVSSAITVNVGNSITVSAQVGPTICTGDNCNGGGGTGGGGSAGGGDGSGYSSTPTTVNFSGMAYPSSNVTILENGVVALTTNADPDANFSASLSNLSTGTYTFSVYAEDVNGIKSLSYSFPVYITSGTIINIGGIFVAPTINVDKSQVEKGDTLTVFGQTIPNSDVNLLFHSNQAITKATTSNPSGIYSDAVDTTPFDYGDHTVQSKTTKDNQVSAMSAEVPFTVGLITKKNNNSCGTIIGDLNCDGKVNIVDFSIMAYWYKRSSPPKKIDLNGDGIINLADFSIMAFYWTG